MNEGPADRPVPRRVGSLFGIDLVAALPFRPDLALREAGDGQPVMVVDGHVGTDGSEVWRSTARPDVVCRRGEAGLTIRWPDAAFAVGDGRIVVDAVDAASAFERYLNPVMSLVVSLQGGTGLHAFTARTPRGTVAIMGRSGYGKTSLGMAMLEREGQLVTDDLLVFDAAGAVQPGPRFVRLDTADTASHDPAGKTRLVVPAVEGSVDIDLVIVFSRDASGFTKVDRQMHAVDLLLEQVYSPIAPVPTARQANLTQAVRLAGSTAVYLCERFHQPVEQLADQTMEWLAQR